MDILRPGSFSFRRLQSVECDLRLFIRLSLDTKETPSIRAQQYVQLVLKTKIFRSTQTIFLSHLRLSVGCATGEYRLCTGNPSLTWDCVCLNTFLLPPLRYLIALIRQLRSDTLVSGNTEHIPLPCSHLSKNLIT